MSPSPGPERPADEPRSDDERAAAARIRHQASWVDLQLRQAIARGEFDGLPGYGKPIADLGDHHDPDWWVKRLVEREEVTGVLPPALLIRKEDAELDERLDRITTESEVRGAVAEFNERVRWALYRPSQGPPMITAQRDPAVEVDRWRARREERLAAQRRLHEATVATKPVDGFRGRWLPRRLRRWLRH